MTSSSIFSLRERGRERSSSPVTSGPRTKSWFQKFKERAKEGGPGSGPQPKQPKAHPPKKKKAKTAKTGVTFAKSFESGSPSQSGQPPVTLWFDKAARAIAPGDPEKNSALVKHCKRLMGVPAKASAREADSASAFPVTMIGAPKKEALKFRTGQIRESAAAQATPTKFDVVLIQEGLGNLGDAFYYTREALESAVDVFNGVKCFADHPSADEDEIRPERSVRDIFGHFENLRVEEGEGGVGELRAVLDTIPSAQWARDLMVRAIENEQKFPETPFVGLSINANGNSDKSDIDDIFAKAPPGAKAKLQEAKDQGIETVKAVQLFTSAVSCDLVTEAGAGGKILNIIKGDE